ncbi:type II secretion system F family protein [Methanococcus aeolicus]|uniref:Type II secretion system protein GspF domain-containing protein n=1 Tax=Methanococcus aeolicus (strain ATCC BAA-1280 / DSM 17508 / OCM 812 / Nankai-3) TaxID=419665 RepID=A6UW58_META3|nr:type II secretion system F family protein [Methanococcus aeolicus]ABR56730.1 conserved hypothetical protein [Methanococcus aeolicus Nankai-3]UXM84731.1 type II secretion system F family protein [Methanococcus aeolicus]
MAQAKKDSTLKIFVNNLLYKLGFKKRKSISATSTPIKGIRVLKKLFEEGELEFYESYEDGKIVKNIEEIIPSDSFLSKSSESLVETVNKTSFLPSKRDYQYIGVSDLNGYFLKTLIKSFGFGVLFLMIQLVDGDVIYAITQSIVVFLLFLIGGIFYPKIKLMLFKGEVKLQIMMAMLHMVSMLNSGASLQECIKNIGSNSDYGIVSFEFKNVIYDIVRGGYNFKESLERAKNRTGISLMEKLYAQLITASNQGKGQLLLQNLYGEIIRETMSTLDNSKFQIGNLGNLVFGTGLILPFSGMLQSALTGGGGFDGINNTIDLVLTKIGPISTIMFAIFVKIKIE